VATGVDPAWVVPSWAALRGAGVTQLGYVPDAGLAGLIRLAHADPAVTAVPLSTEEEGVALAVGAWLGGQRAMLAMQSSGVGNTANMLSLVASCRAPLLAVVTMRGQFGEANPWQLPMGQATPTVLGAMGVVCFAVDDAERVTDTVTAAATMAFSGPAAVAVLIGQRVIGAKAFAEVAGGAPATENAR
jgi:sulfopyruvate decarboxylase TPP-binding subunit